MNLKTNKGITLIALVITIIVLLILAGVTISMVLGDDGIITNATNAKEETEKMEYPERVRLAVASAVVKGKGKVDTKVYINEQLDEMNKAKSNSIQLALATEFGDEFGAGKKVTYTEEKITIEGDEEDSRTFTVDTKGTVAEVVEEEPDDEGGDLAGGDTREIITFSFHGEGNMNISCQAYEGDTWAEWLESDLANDDFVIDDYGYLFYVYSNGLNSSQVDGVSVMGYGVYITSVDVGVYGGEVTDVAPTSDIIANQQYWYPYT